MNSGVIFPEELSPASHSLLDERGAAVCALKLLTALCQMGASNGQVAVSAFGSGCACPTAVIAICPICQCSAEPQLEVCSAVHPSSLCPLAAFASWALQGYACIQVKGHSLPVVLL